MRTLSRITFINSASGHLRWESIELNGNTFLVGENGVGKTVIDRAVIFFYTADKGKLGIDSSKKSFDEFYLPSPQSYIVYEVERGGNERPFSIITFRGSSGFAEFKFVDSPFRSEWVRNEKGLIVAGPSEVDQRIEKEIARSKIIRNYEDYRKIIYGQYGSGFLCYRLIRHARYTELIGNITNIFLNSKLDASGIKETIISAATTSAQKPVNLSSRTEDLKEFMHRVEEIKLWNEDTDFRKAVSATIENRQLYISNESELTQTIGQLMYAMEREEEQIPLSEADIGKLNEKISSVQKTIKDLSDKYTERRDGLMKAKALLEDKVKTCKEKEKEYSRPEVIEKIKAVDEKPTLLEKKRGVERTIGEFNRKYDDITSKYNARIATLRCGQTEVEQALKTEMIKAQNDFNERVKALLADKSRAEDELNKIHEDKVALLLASRDELMKRHSAVEMDISTTRNTRQNRDEVNAYRADIEKIEKDCISLREEIEKKRRDILLLDKELDKALSEAEKAYSAQANDIVGKRERKEEEKAELDDLLSSTAGSLGEWLDRNKPHWGDTIGRVADEALILKGQGLSPALSEGVGDDFFGIKVDLSAVERRVRTPKEIQERIKALNMEIRSLDGELEALRIALFNDKTLANGTCAKKKKKIEDAITQCQIRITNGKKEVSMLLSSITQSEKEEDERQSLALARLEERKRLVLLEQQENRAAIDGENEGFRRGRKKISSDYSARERDEKSALSVIIQGKNEEIKRNQADFGAKIQDCERLKSQELEQNGADAGMLKALNEELGDLEKRLTYIDEVCMDFKRRYLDDLSTYLSHKNEFIQELKRQGIAIDGLAQRYEDEQDRKNAEVERIREEVSKTQVRISQMREGVQSAKEKLQNESLSSYISLAQRTASEKSCLSLVKELQDKDSERWRRQDALKRSISAMRGKIRYNTFKLPDIDNALIENYLDYAKNVDDMVAYDLVGKSKSISNALADKVITGLYTEYDPLKNSVSEVQRIVNNLNAKLRGVDFVSAIQSIEIQVREREDKLSTLLNSIRDFVIENPNYSGNINLFSNADEDDKLSKEAVDLIKRLSFELMDRPQEVIGLNNLIDIKFRVNENGNDSGWIEYLKDFGSQGTGLLIKAIINIVLLSISMPRGKDSEASIHCVMDESGTITDTNTQGILDLANKNNINVVNSAPRPANPEGYRYFYYVHKDRETKRIQLEKTQFTTISQ